MYHTCYIHFVSINTTASIAPSWGVNSHRAVAESNKCVNTDTANIGGKVILITQNFYTPDIRRILVLSPTTRSQLSQNGGFKLYLFPDAQDARAHVLIWCTRRRGGGGFLLAHFCRHSLLPRSMILWPVSDLAVFTNLTDLSHLSG